MDIKAFLVENGFTGEEIAAMPEKQQKTFAVALGKFDEGSAAAVKAAADLETARAEKEEAAKFWEEKVTPALAGTDRKIAEANSEAARYKAYLTSLKAQGYDVPESLLTAPVKTEPVRDPDSGKYVTPDQMGKEFRAVAPTMVKLVALSNEYQDLYGSPYIAGDADWEEAQAARKPFSDFVRDKYKFAAKRQERETKKTDELVASRVAEQMKVKEAELATKYGSNADLRSPLPSKFDKLEKSLGDRKDSWKSSAGREAAKKDRLERFSKTALNVQ